MRRVAIFRFIDIYPDFATFIFIFVFSLLQLMIGNNPNTIVLAVSLMLPTLIIILPMNILMKRIFKTKRPRQYYRNARSGGAFENSFPSFHSQFSAGVATAFVVGIALYSPNNIRLIATLLAVVTMGPASALVAWSRVALGMHHHIDAKGGFVLGVITGFTVSYIFAQLIGKHFPSIYHVFMILIFAVIIFLLSREQRGIRKK